jgi:hypothetical protein
MGDFKYPVRNLSNLANQNSTGRTDANFSNVSLLFQPTAEDVSLVDLGPLSLTLTAQGDAALSTAVADPWGGSRKLLRLDGTGDYVTVGSSSGFAFGTGAGTIEGWIRPDTIDAANEHYLFSTGSTEQTGLYLDDSSNAGEVTGILSGTANQARTSGAATSATWAHVALCWDGSGNIYSWLNGGSGGTGTDANAKGAAETAFIGAFNASFPTKAAYITGVRVTKGVARYTSAFPAPTKPFPIQ